jgi:hypothetical protein
MDGRYHGFLALQPLEEISQWYLTDLRHARADSNHHCDPVCTSLKPPKVQFTGDVARFATGGYRCE